MTDPNLWLAAIVLFFSFLLTRSAIRLARERQVIAHPNERSSHSAPTPSGGGLGLGVVAAGALAAYGGAATWVHDERTALWAAPAFLLACWVGWRDDVKPLPPFVKMALLTAAAAVLVALAQLDSVAVPVLGRIEFGLSTAPLTLFWLAGFANAFNFMDGIDGIAAVTAAVGGVFFAIVGVDAACGVVTALGAITAASALGFLPWNFPRAKVFMGDAGSLVLGLLLAYTAIVAAARDVLPFPASVLLLGPFIFDATFTLARRAGRGERVWQAHREHLYQRLSRLWGSHPPVTLLYGLFSVVCGVLALGYRGADDAGRLLSLGAPLAAMLAFAVLVLRADRAATARVAAAGESGADEHSDGE